MASTPEFYTIGDNTTSPNFDLVSSVFQHVLRGTVSENAVDMQVSINGAPFKSDPDLIAFSSGTFTVPDPNVLPQGIVLSYGTNSIRVRAVMATGEVTSPAEARIEIISTEDAHYVRPPTGLRVRRRRDEVEIIWAASDMPDILGYHIYAATEGGGGSQGYVRINKNLIADIAFHEERVRHVSEDSTFYTSSGGQIRVLLIEEDFNDNPIGSIGEFVIDTSLNTGSEMKAGLKLEEVLTSQFHHFIHNRAASEDEGVINNEFFAALSDDEPLYYVITAISYDPETNQHVESAYSSELVGIPLVISTNLREIPTRDQTDIARDYISSIIRNSDNKVSVIPGSVVRDIFIDPFSSETERLHFIANFIRRSQSFVTLLEIDNGGNGDDSIPVSQSPYKQALKAALGFSSDTDVQALIDDSFDKLASNYQKVRGGAQRALGTATFYTTTEPTNDVVIETGTLLSAEGGISFQTTSRVVLPLNSRDSFYNVQMRRWEIRANIRALEAGEGGNVAAGAITTVLGGPPNVRVTNLEATRFGRDRESNARLAERAMLALSGVDSGTASGYLATVLEHDEVRKAKVIKAGDSYMLRDYDEVRHKHIGGKVDIWVQGEEEKRVTDTFALRYRLEENVSFVLASAPSDLIFRAEAPFIDENNPIVEVLGATTLQKAQGFGFRKTTTGEEFDLTGYEILNHNTIRLDTSLPQPSVSPTDFFQGDIRLRDTSDYIFTTQPVLSVDTVQDLETGTPLEEGEDYDLFRLEDPLLKGLSTGAKDFLRIYIDDVAADMTSYINDERHVLVGTTRERLNSLGINAISVRVFSLDRSIAYNGPNTPNPDFLVEEGDPLSIYRVEGGAIANGEEVSVDYEHNRNFSVTYNVNNTLQVVQESVDAKRHVTADVLVKGAASNKVDLDMTIILQPGVQRAETDSKIRSSLTYLLNSKSIGEPVYQSDIIHAVEDVKGVDYVVVPLAKMALADGSPIIKERLSSDATVIDSASGIRVYALTQKLAFPTIDNGGIATKHKGVFRDTQEMRLVSDYNRLFDLPFSAMIVGSGGRSIQGYSDNTTLIAQGFRGDDIEKRRLELSSNRVFLSYPSSSSPGTSTLDVSYYVHGDIGSKSIIPSPVTFLELGNVTITYGGGS